MADFGSIRRRWNHIGIAESDSGETEATPAASSTCLQRADGTFFGEGAVFEGALSLTGDFRIDSEFRGELETDGTIVVGPEGSVVGSIRAREIVIQGAVVGNVTASRQLIVESEAKLHGDIETACLEIQKHAFFIGKTSMIPPLSRRRVQVSAQV